MKNKNIEYGYRNMRHAQERRMYHAHKDLVHIRGRRHASMLVDPFDDVYYCDQKTWKVKRKKQYRNRSSLNEYTIDLEPSDYEQYLFEYFDEQDIPYRADKKQWYVITQVTYWHHTEMPQKYLDRILWKKRQRYYYV